MKSLTGTLRNASTVAAILFALFISGCGTTPVKDQGDSLADSAFINQQISAAEALIDLDQVEEASAILGGLNFNQLSIAQQTRYVLSQSRVSLATGKGQEALGWINNEYAYLLDGLPLEQQIEIGKMRAQALELSGKPLAAARERIFLAPVLSRKDRIENQDQIWFDLQISPLDDIKKLAAQESSPDLTGWLDLAIISHEQNSNMDQLIKAVEQWQNDNKSHPAAKDLPNSLQMLRELTLSQPKQIGVLLPLSGPLEQAGKAIRDGLLSNWYSAKANGQEVPQISFYDTANIEDAVQLYNTAVDEGAELIIGPLAKNKVEQLARHQKLDVPVLALNYTNNSFTKTNNFYQFGLAPEDEAIQIAEDIWLQGARNIMVVSPATQWGDRVADAFITRWELLGGTITSKARFNRPDQYLYSVKYALNISNSERRHIQLARLLDADLEFEFRRRQDVDMIFMVAFPDQARQLKPILNYQRAADISIVATSNIYAGELNQDKDRDLNDVHFVEMPWRLYDSAEKQQASLAFPSSVDDYASLVALGTDAYKLYPRVPQMSVFNDVRIHGVTGLLSMSDNGRIKRQLDWAQIKNGIAIPAPLQEPNLESADDEQTLDVDLENTELENVE
ncbi:penicillin-binding protein activator [Reinekea thalattae]|nr:penicillin-binding protein activator [Reinekea thalattae]